MRCIQCFQKACTRSFSRLCHSCPHIAAASVHSSGAAFMTTALNRSSSRSLFTRTGSKSSDNSDTVRVDAPSARVDFDNNDSSAENCATAAADYSPSFASSTASDASPRQSTLPSSFPAPLTLEQLEAFVRRHSHLCENMSLFSASPSVSAPSAAHGTLFAHHANETNSASALHGGATLAPLSDGHHRHSPRAHHASDAVVAEVRTMLDRVAQAAHVLGALAVQQRRRLIIDVCRIGYVVGLHSRCCALYVDTVLLTPRMAASNKNTDDVNWLDSLLSLDARGSSNDPASSTNSTSDASAEMPAGYEPPPSAIPDFVIEAAGEAADLPTLTHCLACAARVMKYDAAASSDTGAAEPMETNTGWLIVLQIFVQCVRVALQRGWHGLQTSSKAHMSPLSSPSSMSCELLKKALKTPADVAERLKNRNTEGTSHVLVNIEERWHHFTTQVLCLLRIQRGEEASFFSATLRSVRYHYADTGGDWPAAQAAIYARCFGYLLNKEEHEPANTNRDGVAIKLAESREAAIGGACLALSSSNTPQATAHLQRPTVCLTCPALVTLLRAAVAARQYNIAEWATLYVDACLEEWTTQSGTLPDLASSSSYPKLTAATEIPAQLDVLLVWYLRYLRQSAQHRRACRWLRRLRTRQSVSPLLVSVLSSLPLLRTAARLAGESLDADLALWCLQLCLGDTTGFSPTHHDIFVCLCAFARCGTPTFDMVLQSLQSNGLLFPDAEELLFVQLLHARRSVHWRSEWEHCMLPYIVTGPENENGESQIKQALELKKRGFSVSSAGPRRKTVTTVTLRLFASAQQQTAARPTDGVAEAALSRRETERDEELSRTGAVSLASTRTTKITVFSARVIYQILLLLQEGEHPAFMAYYRTFLNTFSEHVTVNDRAKWALLALAWASLQHGGTAVEDVVYIVREVEQLMTRQAEHHASQQRNVNNSLPKSRPLPIAADLYRNLEWRWASLYKQYSPTWWATISSGDKAPLLLDPASVQCMAAKARTCAAASMPAFARFVKNRRCLPCAEVPASEMLLASVRHTSSVPSPSSLSSLLKQRSDTLHQLDREQWTAYVASDKKKWKRN